jgi:hypothetical protein
MAGDTHVKAFVCDLVGFDEKGMKVGEAFIILCV